MLSIRDENVRTLAKDLMQKTGAPTITAAIRLALEDAISRAEEAGSLQHRVDVLRRKAIEKAVRPPMPALTKDERDHLWER